MMEKNKVEEIFERCGAKLTGHFVLASGRHSDTYLEKALVYTDPRSVFHLCFDMASKVYKYNIEVVVGPAVGGVNLSSMTAYHLEDLEQRKVLSFFTEKDEKGKQALRRGYQKLIAGKRVLVVDDILTTGGSIQQVKEEVEKAGARVVAVHVICKRGDVIFQDILRPLFWLWETDIISWPPDQCPLCQRGVPITNTK